ncbi:MAG: radical SAM protein [Nitrospirae bacterium]|nr:radical SAM protein [Nitrospirota bacterium]
MIIKEIKAKSILSKSQIYDYTLNAYVGCQHNCIYCYAKFMKRFTGHKEAWGDFVDVKINAPELLAKEVKKKKKGAVWISGVCDAYQPLEEKYELSRKCIEILVENDWTFTIQTKSPIVLRDIELFKKAINYEVGFSISTAQEKIRSIFEPSAPPIMERVNALAALHNSGIKTFVMIAPMLPGVEGLPEILKGNVDYVMIDRMNYHYADWLYKKQNMQYAMGDEFFIQNSDKLLTEFKNASVDCQRLF